MYNNNYNIFNNHTATDGNVFEFYVDIIKVPIVIQIRRVLLKLNCSFYYLYSHQHKFDCNIIIFIIYE